MGFWPTSTESMGRRPHPERDRALDAVRGGTPIAQVADAFGVSRQTVYSWCFRAGLRVAESIHRDCRTSTKDQAPLAQVPAVPERRVEPLPADLDPELTAIVTLFDRTIAGHVAGASIEVLRKLPPAVLRSLDVVLVGADEQEDS